MASAVNYAEYVPSSGERRDRWLSLGGGPQITLVAKESQRATPDQLRADGVRKDY